MKIALPPRTTNAEGNLTKQAQVFDLCFNSERDIQLHYPLDCPLLTRIHSPAYVRRARELGCNGFSDVDYRKVHHAEASVNAMVAATEAAVIGGRQRVAFAPVSGFHHASYSQGGGFCTFNGLVVAAAYAHEELALDRVLILDGDGHFGNGTQELIEHHDLKSWLLNWWVGRDNSDTWHRKLTEQLKTVNLVIYQAGADAHVDDPYGVGSLSTGEWIQRDRFIFQACHDAGVPVVWNLAGGYNGAKTLDLHTSTFETACEVFYPSERPRSIARGSTVAPQLEYGRPDGDLADL